VLSIELLAYRIIFPRRSTKYIAFSFSRAAASTGWSSVAIFSNDNSDAEVAFVLLGTTSGAPHAASGTAKEMQAVASVKARQFFI
jgi:hypothetical protein